MDKQTIFLLLAFLLNAILLVVLIKAMLAIKGGVDSVQHLFGR